MRDDHKRHRLAALVLGVLLAVFVIASVAMGGIGQPSLPDGAVALVEDAPDGEITDEEYERSLEQAAFNLNLEEVPPEDDPQREQVEQSALSNLIQIRWVRGEAEERGIEVTERDVDVAFEQIVREQLGGEEGLQRFLKEAPFTEDEVREVAELTEVSDRLQADALGEEPPAVDEALVEDFYEQNIDQFTQPESRDVREIVSGDEGEVEQAAGELGDDPTPSDWKRVAAEFSEGPTKDEGGLRRGLVEGQEDPALEEEIFGAPEGEIVGPFETEAGFHLIQVESVTPAEVTPIAEAREQIEAQLGQGLQGQEANRFRQAFISKWRARTVCADELRIELCANADPPPDACPSDDESERAAADPALLDQGCEAPVAPRAVVGPGSNSGFPGEQPLVLPQGPISPPDAAAAAGGLPPGLQGLPPGTVPPGGAPPPQGAAPPAQGAAPPAQGGTAPPPGG